MASKSEKRVGVETEGAAALAGGGALDRQSTIELYHSLIRKRRTGQASDDELRQLAEVSLAIESEPAPAEFQEAMKALARDRQGLRESMERIERLLNRTA